MNKWDFKNLNKLIGLAVFIISLLVYLLTLSPTVNFWDCGEYISSAYKLEVGHPPGAPFYQLMVKITSFLSHGSTNSVAKLTNAFSALTSAFSVMFLFWITTILSRKITNIKNPKLFKEKFIILSSAFIGAMAFTFSDSQWFSAVETEVYAFSTLFTAFIFWSALKFKEEQDPNKSNRWILLIALTIGLSMGVHLLTLLVIPAISIIFYSKFTKTPKWYYGLSVFILSVLIVGLILNFLIPSLLSGAAVFDLIAVNRLNMPFNTGMFIFFALIVMLFSIIIFITHKLKKQYLNIICLATLLIIIGSTPYAIIMIRSSANTPLDENNPDSPMALKSYFQRDQYGKAPLIYGQYYSSPTDIEKPYKNGKFVYGKDYKNNKYIVIDKNINSKLNYDKQFCTLFPRMWSSNHADSYKEWIVSDVKQIQHKDKNGQVTYIDKPSFGQNVKYFASYQVGFMYFRYFMWNFSGKQNDAYGSNVLQGNAITGISIIDKLAYGPQKNLAYDYANNKGHNRYFMLPFLLGIIGFIFHFLNNKRDWLSVSLLFFMTSIAVIVFLNQTPGQARERDYAYIASFMAFSIWIGIGVLGILSYLVKKKNNKWKTIASAIILFCAVPGLMAQQGWDDHDRSGRYLALDLARNTLNSCEANAILFVYGDNETFPLWYAQEVEEIRTDVRVININLFSTSWNIRQSDNSYYESYKLPLNLEEEQYIGEKRSFMFIQKSEYYHNANDIYDFLLKDDDQSKIKATSNKYYNYAYSDKVFLDIDSNIHKDYFSYYDSLDSKMQWQFTSNNLKKSDLALLDIIIHNNWERPIYFANSCLRKNPLGLKEYLWQEGLIYRLVPLKNSSTKKNINLNKSYQLLMSYYQWTNTNNPKVYHDETCRDNINKLRKEYNTIARELLTQGRNKEAVKVLDLNKNLFYGSNVPMNKYSFETCELYLKAGEKSKGINLSDELINNFEQNLDYYYNGFKVNNGLYFAIESKQMENFNLISGLAYKLALSSYTNKSIYILNMIDKYVKQEEFPYHDSSSIILAKTFILCDRENEGLNIAYLSALKNIEILQIKIDKQNPDIEINIKNISACAKILSEYQICDQPLQIADSFFSLIKDIDYFEYKEYFIPFITIYNNCNQEEKAKMIKEL